MAAIAVKQNAIKVKRSFIAVSGTPSHSYGV